MLRVGQIEYANCTPIYHILRKYFPSPGYRFISGVPTELNRLLLLGHIDVCPSSSIAFALHYDKFRILPNLSISSDGSVASVLLFSKIPIEEMNGKTILLSSESATSVNLLKVLMFQRYKCSCSYTSSSLAVPEAMNKASALLLIGDAALRASFSDSDLYIYDLGSLWREWTGLPFVFALWLCRREVAEKQEIREFTNNLIQSRTILPFHFSEIASTALEAEWMGHDKLLTYWRENIQYDLDDPKISGLMTFYEKCCEMRLIMSVPNLDFTTL